VERQRQERDMTDEIIGAHQSDDRRGLLVFDGLPADLHKAEDATLTADHERAMSGFSAARFDRPATPVEKHLLRHLGHAVPDELTTVVTWLDNGSRRRDWPQLHMRSQA
jgi:hypothetical protein